MLGDIQIEEFLILYSRLGAVEMRMWVDNQSVPKYILVIMIILLPWALLEVRPRVIWMDAVSILWFGSLLLKEWRTKNWKRQRLPRVLVEYGVLIGLWVSAILASGLAVWKTSPYAFEAMGYLYLAVWSWILSYILSTQEDVLWAWRIFAISLSVVLVFGAIGLAFGQTGYWESIFYNNAHKLTATFRYPNQLAGFLILFVPWLWIEWRQARSHSVRLTYTLALLLIFAELLASGSRAGIAAAALSIMLDVFLLFLRVGIRGRISFRLLGWMAVMGALLGALVVFLQDRIAVINRSLSVIWVLLSGKVTDTFRLVNWWQGLQMFEESPVFGGGIAQASLRFHYEIHNTFIALLAETGFWGALTFGVLLAYILSLSWKSLTLTPPNSPWNNLARGLFLGLVGELIFATQHLMTRSRHLWAWFAFIVALYIRLTRLKRGS